MQSGRKSFFFLASIALLMLLTVCTQAATTWNVPANFATIQAAIDTAGAGDTILVAAGTYSEALVWSSKDLTIQGAGVGLSIIDVSGSTPRRCLTATSLTSASHISGFTLQNGSAVLIDGHGGGGMRNTNSSPTITDCAFKNNYSATRGGGMDNTDSSPTLINCTFDSNTNFAASGMNNTNSSPTLINCTFEGIAMGTILYTVGGSLTMTDCRLSGSRYYSGGAIHLEASSGSTITNCIFSENFGQYGAGIYSDNSNPQVINCTFADNVSYYTCGIYATPTSTAVPTVTNCIMWGNQAYNDNLEVSDNVNISYSDVDLLPNSAPDANGNFAADPLFVDPDNGDYYLAYGSPCRNAGNNAVVTSPLFLMDPTQTYFLDRDGNPRIVDTTVDMGAYEVQITVPIEVVGSISVKASGFTAAGGANYTQTLTLTNTGASAINGPLYLLLDNLGGANVQLTNPSGTTHILTPSGRPYLALSSGLAAQGSVKVTLKFSNPNKTLISYTPHLFAGAGSL